MKEVRSIINDTEKRYVINKIQQNLLLHIEIMERIDLKKICHLHAVV